MTRSPAASCASTSIRVRFIGAMESPGHWIDVASSGEIFIGSLTGNVFRWYPDWMETEAAAQAERP